MRAPIRDNIICLTVHALDKCIYIIIAIIEYVCAYVHFLESTFTNETTAFTNKTAAIKASLMNILPKEMIIPPEKLQLSKIIGQGIAPMTRQHKSHLQSM